MRGLNSPEKRYIVLKEMERYFADIIFLQEMHILLDPNTKLYSRAISTWYYTDTPNKRSKGVAIGISRNISFTVDERKVDECGQVQGIISVSDYAPVTVKIRFRDMESRKGLLRLNEDLIDDEEVGRTIMTEIEQYFK